MQRFEQLDSLRGLAALTVMIGHYLFIFPTFSSETGNDGILTWLLKSSPLYLLRSGHEAVLLFFVLSGFVLSLQFYKNTKINYRDFAIKRFFRIYIPYIVSIFLAVLLIVSVDISKIGALSDWFNGMWHQPITPSLLIQHLIMILGVNSSATNTVVWSLVYEMDISLMFPLFMLIILKLQSRWVLLGCLFLTIITHNFIGNTTIQNLSLYSSMFVCGALLARHQEKIRESFTKLNYVQRLLVLLVAFAFYMYGIIFESIDAIHTTLIDGAMTTIGSLLIISICLSSRTAKNILMMRYVHFIGKISYSLYLYHVIVLLTFIHLFYDSVPLLMILLISAVVTLILSAASYRWIELPSIQCGKLLVEKLNSFRVIERIKKSV